MPAHRLGLDQGRGDHRGEAVRQRGVHREVQQRQLQARADAGQVVEARAGDLGAAVGVDRAQALAQLEVVARLDGPARRPCRGRAHRLEHDVVVLAAGRHAVDDHVADRHEHVVELGRQPGGLRLALLDLRRELLGAGQHGGLLLAGRGRDLLADLLLLGAQLLELGLGGPPAGVQVHRGVDDGLVLPTGSLAGSDDVGGVPQQLEVDHPPSVSIAGGLGRQGTPWRARP